jgi:hypothetical protein
MTRAVRDAIATGPREGTAPAAVLARLERGALAADLARVFDAVLAVDVPALDVAR